MTFGAFNLHFNSSSFRFSDSSAALRSSGLWIVRGLWFEVVALASKLTLIAASGDRCRGAVLVAVVGVIFSRFGWRWFGLSWWPLSAFMLLSSASNTRRSASKSLSGEGKTSPSPLIWRKQEIFVSENPCFRAVKTISLTSFLEMMISTSAKLHVCQPW